MRALLSVLVVLLGRLSWRRRATEAVVACILLTTQLSAVQAAGTTIYVDRSNSACSDAGSGTASAPFCTIVQAAKIAVAGQTVLVASGTYPERIVVANSGTSGSPISFQPAPGATVTISGQVNGFVTFAKSWVTVAGFNITGTSSYGIYLWNSSNMLISGNHISYSGQPVNGSTAAGIYITGTTDSLIVGNTTDHNSDAGIYLTSNSARVEIRNNVSFSNARGYVMAAPGIDVRAPGNLIDGNICYSNEDTGIQIYPGGDSSIVVNNVTYKNGEYGVDVLNATGATIVSNSSYDNVYSGINVEGTSSGARLANNITVQNGFTNGKGNIRIDPQSTPGSSIDYDIVKLYASGWNIVWGTNNYTTLAAFQTATGQEAHGIEADPKWVGPDSGDLRPQAGSPAIDSADSGAPSELSTDRDGNPRIDDSATVNTGAGPRGYDDRGAYEFQGSLDQAPVAALSVSPSSGTAPVLVTADASGSTDTDVTPIATYAFDFGDGTIVGPQAGATATHTYDVVGTFTVTVTVADTGGKQSTAQKQVNVLDDPPIAALTVTPSAGFAPLPVTADASGSTDTDITPIATYRFNFGDGTIVGPQAGATATHTYTTAGSFTVTATVTDTGGKQGTAQKPVKVTNQYVTNPGFETNTAGWAPVGSPISLGRVAGGHSGGWSAVLTNTGSSTSSCGLTDSPNWVQTTAGGTYTAQLWVRGPKNGGNSRLTLGIQEFVGTSSVGSTGKTVKLSTSWQLVTLTYTAVRPGSSTLDLSASVPNAAPGTCFYADDASFILN